MSTYRDLAEKARANSAVTMITAKRWKPAEVGDSFCGLLVERSDAHSRQFDSDFSVYKFKTDDGLINFIPGSATDAEIGAFLEPGQIYEVTYLGKEETAAGQERNRYQVLGIDMAQLSGV